MDKHIKYMKKGDCDGGAAGSALAVFDSVDEEGLVRKVDFIIAFIDSIGDGFFYEKI